MKNTGRTLVLGDVHCAYKALKQCLERSNFDYENDTLISLGDIVDGWSQTYECVEELLKIKNLIPIMGNHDVWFTVFINMGIHPVNWLQGGYATAQSYASHADHPVNVIHGGEGYITNLNPSDIPESHRNFFNHQITHYIDDKNRCFVHGGFDRWESIKNQDPSVLYWDRDLWNQALSCKGKTKLKTVDDFSEIFIGHTTTGIWGKDTPMHSGGVWNLDTGAGWEGKLTIMDVDTYQMYQSDNVKTLYPDEAGRR